MTPRSNRTGVVSLACAFAGLGGTAAVVPAVLPIAASRFPAEAELYLRAVPATFTGLLLGVLLTTLLSRATSLQSTVGLGSVVQAGAMAALLTAPPAFGFVLAAACAGLGFGLVEAAGSALARELAETSTTPFLAALTGIVALVAAGCPLLVAFLPQQVAPVSALALVAAVHLATTACVVASTARTGRGRRTRPAPATPLGEDSRQSRWSVRESASLALALALYVGVESVYSGWSAVIAANLLGAGAERSALGTSAFWILMAIGRFAVSRILRSRPARTRHILLTLAGAAALLLLAAGSTPAATGILVSAAVVLLGPCYSMLIGLGLSRVPPARAARATGPLVACGALGGAGVPWILLAVTGSPTSASVPVISAALLMVAGVLLVVRRPPDVPLREDRRRSATA